MKKISTEMKIRIATLVMLCIGVIMLAIVCIKLSSIQSKNRNDEEINTLDIMNDIVYLYNTEYIGDLENSTNEIATMTLKGFVAGFHDKYGAYLSPEEFIETSNERDEKLVGIGVDAVYEDGLGFYIAGIYDNSPAEKAGLKIGDYIIEVNGIKLNEDTADTFVDMVRGEEGTIVSIKLNNGEIKEIIREHVDIKSVKYKLINDTIGYIKIKSFTNKTDEEFTEVINNIKENGITNVIIDLRNNYGGVADTVINMADNILPEGLIAEFISKDERNNREYYSDKNEFTGNIVILVNGNTASASELFSKALQDYNKAIVIGTNTYGKGTVLKTYQLRNGGAITLSTGKYYTISGEEIEEIGVKPDIQVELDYDKYRKLYKLTEDEDDQLQAALKYFEGMSEN